MPDSKKKKKKHRASPYTVRETSEQSQDVYSLPDAQQDVPELMSDCFSSESESEFVEVTRKRHRTKSSSSSQLDLSSDNTELSTLIISCPDQNIAKANPIELKKEFNNLLGHLPPIRPSKNCIIVTVDQEDFRKIKAVKNLGKFRIKSSEPNVPKQNKAIIHAVPVAITEEEILQELRQHKVSQVKRLGTKQKTESVVLTFPSESFPPVVEIGCYKYKTKTFIPKPTRCYNCQQFGHVAKFCVNNKRCPKCSENHSYEECKSVLAKCLNCGGQHSSAFRGCTSFKNAQKITEYKTLNKMSYAQAAKAIPSTTPKTINLSPNRSPPSVIATQVLKSMSQSADLLQKEEGETTCVPESPTSIEIDTDRNQLVEKIKTAILTISSITASNLHYSDKARTIASFTKSLFNIDLALAPIERAIHNHSLCFSDLD